MENIGEQFNNSSGDPQGALPAQQDFRKSDLKSARRENAMRRRMIKRIAWSAGIILFLGAVISGIFWLIGKSEKQAPGAYYPSVGQEHIALKGNPPKPYNSNPPSSGGHFGRPAHWGVYDYEVNDKIFIHNLEHGGVWIAYRPSVATSTVDALKSVVNEFGGSKIVMAPRSANDSDIAIVAWTRVLKIDLAGDDISDEQLHQIRAFYRAYKNRGPEFVPDSMPGVDPKSMQ